MNLDDLLDYAGYDSPDYESEKEEPDECRGNRDGGGAGDGGGVGIGKDRGKGGLPRPFRADWPHVYAPSPYISLVAPPAPPNHSVLVPHQ